MTTPNPGAAPDQIVTVIGRTIDEPGRFLITAGRNHFLSDAKASDGGKAEAVQAGELLLSSLASCGLNIIQRQARETGVALTSANLAVTFKRDPDDKTRYEYIKLHARLAGVDQPTAETLVEAFTSSCPIYNTLKRGGRVEIEVSAV